MAEPRVLVLGDSFIRRLHLFLSRDSHHFSVDFKLSHLAFIKRHGVGGRTHGFQNAATRLECYRVILTGDSYNAVGFQ